MLREGGRTHSRQQRSWEADYSDVGFLGDYWTRWRLAIVGFGMRVFVAGLVESLRGGGERLDGLSGLHGRAGFGEGGDLGMGFSGGLVSLDVVDSATSWIGL